MGYYTQHILNVRKSGKDQHWTEEEIDELIEALEEKKVWNYALNEVFENEPLRFDGYEFVKWYNSDRDMKEISKKFPDYTFQLHGDGDNPDDFWFNYYKNGVSEYCPAELTYKEPKEIVWEGDTQR